MTAIVTLNGVPTEDATLTYSVAPGYVPMGLGTWQTSDDGTTWITVGTGISFTPGDAEVGKFLRVEVDAWSIGLLSPPGPNFSGASTVLNVNDVPEGFIAIDGTVERGATLVLMGELSDDDGPPASIADMSVTWQAYDEGIGWRVVQEADLTAEDPLDWATFTPTEADVGHQLRAVLCYVDGHGTAETLISDATAPVGWGNHAPTGAIVLDGASVRGQAITADASALADADGMGDVSLRWEREEDGDWTPIDGATAPAYTPGAADIGHALRAAATWTDGHGTVETVYAPTGTIAPRAIALPPHEDGAPLSDAAETYSSADLAARIADGDVLEWPDGAEGIRLADGVLSFGSGTHEAFLARLYLGLLGREGDAGGLAFLGGAARAGASDADLAHFVLSSVEYRDAHGGRTDADFVGDLYAAFLGRPGEGDERAYWEASLQAGASRAEVACRIGDSAEAREHLHAATAGVFVPDPAGALARSLYHTALGREGDAEGIVYWSHAIGDGTGPATLGDGLGATAEFMGRHGGRTDAEFVQALYHDGLGREAEAEGSDYWAGLLGSGAMGRGEVALRIAITQEAQDALAWTIWGPS